MPNVPVTNATSSMPDSAHEPESEELFHWFESDQYVEGIRSLIRFIPIYIHMRHHSDTAIDGTLGS